MKLLYITNGYPPNRWAGTETYTAGIAEGFKNQGNEVNVICVGKWQEGHQYFNGISIDEHNGVPVHRLDFNWAKAPDPFTYLYNNPVSAEIIKGYLNDLNPELVHVTSCETLSASILKVVRDLDLPLILSLTDFWFLCPRFNLLRSDGDNCDGNTLAWDCLRCQLLESKAYRYPRSMLPESSVAWLLTEISKHPFLTRRRGLRGMAGNMAQRKAFLKQALNWPDYRVTASPFVRDVFVSTGVECPIQVQAYGHDLSWLKGWQGKDSSDKIRFGFIGQIIESKGVHLLIEAVNSLPERLHNKVDLVIYGDLEHTPEYKAGVLSLAGSKNNIYFSGIYPHSESARIFSGIDVLVVPSIWYDFPLIIYEAFATQTPVIATRLGGMAEAVTDDVNGLLFERGNVGDLTKQLERILSEPGLLDRLRSQLPRVKTIPEEVADLELIYTEIISRKLRAEDQANQELV